MAPIRRAKSYMTYLIAILITGIFGFLHKAPPVWAEDAKADYNAHVFQYMISNKATSREAKLSPAPQEAKLSPAIQEAKEAKLAPALQEAKLSPVPMAAVNADKFNKAIDDAITNINAKLERNETLTNEDNLLLMNLELAQQYKDLQSDNKDLQNQIGILTQMIKDLQDNLSKK